MMNDFMIVFFRNLVVRLVFIRYYRCALGNVFSDQVLNGFHFRIIDHFSNQMTVPLNHSNNRFFGLQTMPLRTFGFLAFVLVLFFTTYVGFIHFYNIVQSRLVVG